MNFFHQLFHISTNASMLLSPKDHSPALTLTRGTLIVGRVQQIASLFALLTLCWIVIDALFMPQEVWQQLAFSRTLSGLLFIALARSCLEARRIRGVYVRLFCLFAVPILFILSADYILQPFHSNARELMLISAYSYAPFVIASGVSFFPLTVVEVVFLLGLPIAITLSAAAILFPDLLIFNYGLSGIWVLSLILSTSALGAVSQLGFMLKLFDDTAHDSLTGLFRRNVGAAILDQQFQAALRQKATFCILFLDIDLFKTINDQFGHDMGDNVLKEVADHLKNILRRQDILIRWGGEEFLIALPNTDFIQAKGFISRLANEGLGICPNGKPITVSIGAAECKEDNIQNWEALINLADKRVYMAKQAGRNCCVLKDNIQPILQ